MLVQVNELDAQFISNFNSIVHNAAIIDEHGSLAVEVMHGAKEFHHHTAGNLGLAVAIHLGLHNIAFAVFLGKNVYSPIGNSWSHFGLITFLLKVFACEEFKSSVSAHIVKFVLKMLF